MTNLIVGFFKIALIIASPFITILILQKGWFFKFRTFDKMKPIPKETFYKPRSWFKLLFYDFPKQWALDLINYDPNEFREFGLHLIAGEQGTGKTIFVTWFLMELQKQYPKLKIRTNYNFALEDGPIEKWQDLVMFNNGIYGQVDVLDEIQNWFSSLQSKDFPPEMLSEISQQRKQHKMIIGTGQVFNRMAKPIREQVKFLYEPTTYFGVLTIVRKYKPNLDEHASVKKMKLVKLFIIVQNKELRENFDTYKKIVDLSKGGFYDRNWKDNDVVVNVPGT